MATELPPNGTGIKALRGAFILFMASFALCVAAYLFYLSRDQSPETDIFGPYANAVVRSSVPGVAGPAATTQASVVLTQERCINESDVVQVETTVAFRFIERTPQTPQMESDPHAPPYFNRVAQTRQPLCNTITLPITLPPEVVPGFWRIEGFDRCIPCGEVRYWASEPFQVVVPRGQ